MPTGRGDRLVSLTDAYTILVVAGPSSRERLAAAGPANRLVEGRLSLAVRAVRCMIGECRAVAMSVSFSGELAWELHIPNEQLSGAYETFRARARRSAMAPFGLYATESMRLEKGYRHWKADLITEYNPVESGLERFVQHDKPEFVGKAALEKQLAGGLKRRFVSLVIDSDFAPAHPGDSMLAGDTVVGTVSSAGFGHRVGENLAMGFVEPDFAEIGCELEILVIGQRLKARVVEQCRYDPTYSRVRS